MASKYLKKAKVLGSRDAPLLLTFLLQQSLLLDEFEDMLPDYMDKLDATITYYNLALKKGSSLARASTLAADAG
jgi:hypothetical protein